MNDKFVFLSILEYQILRNLLPEFTHIVNNHGIITLFTEEPYLEYRGSVEYGQQEWVSDNCEEFELFDSDIKMVFDWVPFSDLNSDYCYEISTLIEDYNDKHLVVLDG